MAKAPSEDDCYSLRGQRVTPLTESRIRLIATALCTALRIQKSTTKRMDVFMESLSTHGISIEVVEDAEWCEVANAVCDPDPKICTIMVPDKLYSRICAKDANAIFILFHEIGHIILGHKPVLHYQETPVTMIEDSEWQADLFSEQVMKIVGLSLHMKQMSLFK